MKIKVLAGAILSAITLTAPVYAGDLTIEERMAQMEQRLRHMEARLQHQEAALKAKDQQIAELEESQSEGWAPGVNIGGVVELEASRSQEDEAKNSSDLNLATVEIGIEAQVNNWVSASVVLLAEDLDESDGDIAIDEATITLGNPESTPVYFTGGRMGLPFGSFETHMVSDPLTLEMAETFETAALVGFENSGFSAAAYVFNGATGKAGDSDTIDNAGLALGYTWEGENANINLGASYISDITESDGISDAIGDTIVDDVAAYSLHASLTSGPFSVIAEYVATSDSFDPSELTHEGAGAKPSIWNLEAGYSFDLAGHEATAAIGYQETAEASDLEMPEKRLSLGLSVGLAENTNLNLEWAQDEAYAGGSDSDAATVQLAVEF